MVSRMLDPTPEIPGYTSLMWLLGTMKGYSDWSAALDMIAINEDSRYGAVLQNLGSGGALHIMASDDTTRLESRDSDVSIPTLVSDDVTISTTLVNNGDTTLGNASGDSLTVGATSTFAAAATFNGAVSTTAATTLGDAAGDALTVNATATFQAPATFNGNVTVGNSGSDTLTVTAAATFNGTLAANGNTTLGNASGDTLTVNATATFAAPATFDSDVTLGNAVGDDITIGGTTAVNAPLTVAATTYLAFGADPPALGALRLTNNLGVYGIDSGATNVRLALLDTADILHLGDGTNGSDLRCYAGASGEIRLVVGTDIMVAADSTGVGFNGAAPVAPPTLPADATDPASVITLANALKDCLQGNGLAD